MFNFFKRFSLILSSGLGLGLGLGLMIAFYPTTISANLPQEQSHSGIAVVRLKSTQIGIDTVVKRGQETIFPPFTLEAPAIHLDRSAGIGSGRPIIIQGLNRDYSLEHLRQAQLGNEIFVIGSNDGWYRYTVIETKTISLTKLNDHLAQLREVLILYVVNPWQKTVFLVIARPKR